MPRAKLSQKFYSQPIAPEALSHVLRDVLPHIELAHRDGNLAVRLKRMQNMILNGALKMSYGKKICDKAGNEYSREYSKLPLSFPNLNRTIRNALVNHHIEMPGKRCVDIDVATCHPKVFVQLLEKRGVRSDRDLIVKYGALRGAACMDRLLAESVSGITFARDEILPFCDCCALAKSHVQPRSRIASKRPTGPLQKFGADIWGPVSVTSIGGFRYVFGMTAYYSAYGWVVFLKSKDEAPRALLLVVRAIRRVHPGLGYDKSTARLRLDNDSDFQSADF
eukprot:jgi/Tetstr1/428078/TSEL_018133.t1